ncbi:MAG TPA: class I SAM-dependent methyltransferase [Gaiellaceae bacterium]|nr:class I SAM-dependent methyltransferase [Gaiellaceae bacterium]
MKAYYDRRAPEYDDWYEGTGFFAAYDRPGWSEELRRLRETLAALPPAKTLDVACGTGYATRWLPGEIVGLDQSERMLAIARERLPHARFLCADALDLPFADDAFERVVTKHFYGHLEVDARESFLAEARRVAPELIVVDSALRDDVEAEEWQDRLLSDGSRWTVYKRYFTGDGLADELGGGEVLHEGRWFVVVRA